MLRYFWLFLLLLMSTTASAEMDVEFDDDEENSLPVELQTFEGFSDILPVDEYGEARGTKRIVRQQEVIPLIANEIKESATYNLRNAEQVFCYHVTRRPTNYKGYTLDNFALTGYCGELDMSEITTVYEALFTQGPNILTAKSNCHIEPRVMLRFTRGVDYTDVLLSSPCPSFTVFYGGRFRSYNIKQNIIDDIINELEKKDETFHSPALLKQTIANATASNTQEEEILEKKKRSQEPIMNWKQQKEQEREAEQSKTNTNTSGWGKLNNSFKLRNR